jgi:hypothetical protein
VCVCYVICTWLAFCPPVSYFYFFYFLFFFAVSAAGCGNILERSEDKRAWMYVRHAVQSSSASHGDKTAQGAGRNPSAASAPHIVTLRIHTTYTYIHTHIWCSSPDGAARGKSGISLLLVASYAYVTV